MQYRVVTALSVGAVGLTGIVHYFVDDRIFQRFIGSLNPLAAALFLAVLGFVLLSFLLSQGWFAIYRKENLKGLLRSCGLAALFGMMIIPVDLKIVFPIDTNIPFPESLLFYPVIGFFVEILFHVLPLSVLVIALTSIFRNANRSNIVWSCILFVSLLEPVYQTMWMVSSSQYALWAVMLVGLHVFLINLFQLLIFKRYDFTSMYAFRLVYYLFWHIGWGYLRLKVLF